MKTLLALALCACVTLAALAAAPVVRVDNTENAYLVNADGSETNLGAVFDVIGNHLASNPGLVSAVQIAAREAIAKLKADTAAQVAAKEAEKIAAIASANTARDQAIAVNSVELTAAKADAAMVAPLETELAAVKAERDALAARVAALEAEVAALKAPPPPAPPTQPN